MSLLHADTTVLRLEEERSKYLQRLNTQSAKCRHRTFYELASCEARLGLVEEAIVSLREALACGLDAVYADELRTSTAFASLHTLPAFEEMLTALEGNAGTPQRYIYAKGEKERCVNEALMCLHCGEPLENPLVHTCGQMFCTACISPLAQCPHCHLPTVSLMPVIVCMILDKLDALKVHCNRCYRHMERSTLCAHIETCPVVCPAGCKQRVAPAALEDHMLLHCPAVQVTCSAVDVNCPWKGARKDLPGHTRSCVFVKQQPQLRRIRALEEENQRLEARVTRLERIVALGKENL